MQLKQPRVGRIMPGTFAHVIRSYMASPRWTQPPPVGLAEATKRNYKRALDLAEMENGLGGCSVEVVRPALIQAFLDGLADKPGIQMHARTALLAVERFALVRDLVAHPFMTGTSIVENDDGHEPWPLDLVKLAMDKARPDLARAVTLGFHTGQRGSDIVRMGWTDFEQKEEHGIVMNGINVRQKKTGVRLWVPILPDFAAILDTWERRPGPFVLRPRGKPYLGRSELSVEWWKELRRNAALKPIAEAGLVLHGLRSTRVVDLRKRALNPLQISSLVGMSLPMVERYCRLANKSELAVAAVHFLRTPTERIMTTI